MFCLDLVIYIRVPTAPRASPPPTQRTPPTCTGNLPPWLVPCSCCRLGCWSQRGPLWWSWQWAPGSQTCRAPQTAARGLGGCSTARRTHYTSYPPPPSPPGLWTGREEDWLINTPPTTTTTTNNNNNNNNNNNVMNCAHMIQI